MTYWLHSFSGQSWHEFLATSRRVTGFRESHWRRARGVLVGDVLVCYLLRVKRFVGLLKVVGERYRDAKPLHGGESCPVRFRVKTLVGLWAQQGVPVESLLGQLSFLRDVPDLSKWGASVRRSLSRYKRADGEVLEAALREAATNPQERPVDPAKLARSPNIYRLRSANRKGGQGTVVRIPTVEEEALPPSPAAGQEVTHTEIQWRLADLGCRLGLGVWAPRSDRRKLWEGRCIADVPTLHDELPALFNVTPALRRTIENIDVLWLYGGSIMAAFEVEHTTTVYSGLLRLADLVTINPMLNIKLYRVAPDERFAKFTCEIARPTFASRPRPLHTLCRFLPYSLLCRRLEQAEKLVPFLRPEFLDDISELYDPSEEISD